MKNALWVSMLLVSALCARAPGTTRARQTSADEGWTTEFGVEAGELASTGRNPYFVLVPGYQLVLEDGEDRLVISVLAETKVVDGVETRVVEERESEDGELVEVSRNFFAISKRTNSVFYFGEEVDNYKGGQVANHAGRWLSGEKGARFGLMMPGQALLKARYYQEQAPGEAMDRAEIVSLDATLETPEAKFEHCLVTEETTPLEPRERERKTYAPGVGLLQDGSMKLVHHGMAAAK